MYIKIMHAVCGHGSVNVCLCVMTVSKGDVEVLISGMQKYKEGKKTAVEWFTSSQRDRACV